MPLPHPLRMLTLMLAFALPSIAAAQHAHTHHEQAVETAAVTAPPEGWATDAPLRAGMLRVHRALQSLQSYTEQHGDATGALQHAEEIDAAVAYMFANCALPPVPDRALHSILLPLLEANRALQADPGALAPIAVMRDTVARYPQLFHVPGWPGRAAAAAN